MNKGLLIIISGPSGSGKGTVVKALRSDSRQQNLAFSISVTTREMRPTEIEGKDYFFRTIEEFDKLRETGELLEHAMFCEHFYGTPRFYVEQKLNEGKAVILEIEVNGALQVREHYKDSVLIFLMPPTLKELRNRLLARGTESMETIKRRMNRAYEEVKLIPQYDYLVINDKVEDVVSEVLTIIEAEKMKTKRSTEQILGWIESQDSEM